jgi:hypothetical protein
VTGDRVKWCASRRRWVEDAAGVDLETARRHGGGPMPRGAQLAQHPIPLPAAYHRAAARALVRGFEGRLAAAAAAAAARAKAARRAAARERARVRARLYFHDWWLRVGKARRIERRAVK